MVDARKEMNDALKEVVVPVLRELGFKGTFPHFYRELNQHVDLFSFQFRLAGGSFVAELSYAEPGRENVYIDKEAPSEQATGCADIEKVATRCKWPRFGQLVFV